MNFNSDADLRECDDIREELQPYLLTQYSASPTIVQLLKDFRDNIDPQADIELFIQKIMDIDTAVGAGLDVLGNIVGIKRNIEINNQTISLDDTNYRKLLKYKALSNITDASLATLNKMMSVLFDDITISVHNVLIPAQDGDMKYNSYPMHVIFTMIGNLSELDSALFSVGGTLSLGAGVGWSLAAIDTNNVFGFKGSGLQPFNQGTFVSDSNIIYGGA